MALTPKRLFLYLCISISLLRPYTLFSRSPLVNKTLFVAVVGENDSLDLTFFFQAVTDRCAPAFGAFFFTGSRSEEEGAEAHGPEDRPSAGRSSFFLLPWNCLQFVLKAFSFSRQALLACCCNTPGIHDKLAGNESDRARTAVHRPRTRWSRF